MNERPFGVKFPDFAMTKYLTKIDVLENFPFKVLDVGARGGFNELFELFGRHFHAVGFDMDEHECTRLNRLNEKQGHRFFPFVLGSKREARTFYLTNNPWASGLYKNRTEYFGRLHENRSWDTSVIKEIPVSTVDFDGFSKENNLGKFDFVKLDVEGAELDVLTGCQANLKSMLGAHIEVRFQNCCNQPLFSDNDIFMRNNGFSLFDLKTYGYPKRDLPDVLFKDGKKIPMEDTRGQVMWGDALYFRDWVEYKYLNKNFKPNPQDILKLAALYEIYNLNDCAVELIKVFRDELMGIIDVPKLLDLLTPPFKGRKIPYEEYLAKLKQGLDPKFFDDLKFYFYGFIKCLLSQSAATAVKKIFRKLHLEF